MKPIRTTILALMTAAIAIAPLASAEAHKRHKRIHRGGDVAAAIALGLFTAGVLSRAGRHHHLHHNYARNCYGLPYRAYHRCMSGGYYRGPGVQPHPYGSYPYNELNRHMYKNGR